MNVQRSPADLAPYDVIVIGGGPAGLSAALYLGRSRRRTLVLDAGQPRNAPSPTAHGVFSRDGTSPGQLLADARQQLARYPTVEFRRLEAQRAEAGPLGIVVRLAGGIELRARRLLLTCGVRDELPSIEGLEERWGNTVLHCTYCHGYEMADQPLALYARGKSALTTMSMLWQLSQNLLLCSDGPADLAEEERRALARRDIRIIETPLLSVGGVPGEPQLVLHFADGSTETRSALFLSAPVRIVSRLPQELGCEFDGPGRLVLKDWRTSVPGVRRVACAESGGHKLRVPRLDHEAKETRQEHMRHQQNTLPSVHRANRSARRGIARWSVSATPSAVHLAGRLHSPCTSELRHKVRSLLRRGKRTIVLDLVRVSSIDAAGIGELVRAYNMTVTMHGELRIVHATKQVRELLERVGLFDRLTT